MTLATRSAGAGSPGLKIPFKTLSIRRLIAAKRPRNGGESLVSIEPANRGLGGVPWVGVLGAALLYLALSIAGIEADDHLKGAMTGHAPELAASIWTKWIPLPLIFAVLVLAAIETRPWRRSIVPPVCLALVAVSVGVRLWVAFRGPLPYLAFREATDLFFTGLAAIAIGMIASKRPVTTYVTWLAVLATLLLARQGLSSVHFIFRPDLLPVTLSVVWSFVAIGGLGGGIGGGGVEGGTRSSLRIGTVPAHLVAFGLGALLGGLALVHTSGATGPLEPIRGEIEHAVEMLWARSALFGWGRAPFLRLASVMTQPAEMALPLWTGRGGLLAANGLISLLAYGIGAVVIAAIASRRRQRLGWALSSAPQLSLLAAQCMTGLIVFGGPNSSIPLLVGAGWFALGLASPRGEALASGGYRRSLDSARSGAVGVVSYSVAGVVVAIGCVMALAPIRSSSILAEVHKSALGDEAVREAIGRARTINPWSPRPEMAEAAWLRARLGGSARWDESIYLEIRDAYERAMAHDPYDAVIPLQLAQVQVTAGRVDDALRTSRRALILNPSSSELLGWTFLTATLHDRTNVALDMIRRSQSMAPESADWWRRRYRFARMAGRRSEAQLALGVTLTGAAPADQGEWVRASFALHRSPGRMGEQN